MSEGTGGRRPPDPTGRRRLRAIRRALTITGWAAFLAAGALTLLAALRDASPLPGVGVLYVGTVAYGLGEMVRLWERAAFGPLARRPAPSRLRWWLPRVLLVLIVAALPALLLLAGLGRR